MLIENTLRASSQFGTKFFFLKIKKCETASIVNANQLLYPYQFTSPAQKSLLKLKSINLTFLNSSIAKQPCDKMFEQDRNESWQLSASKVKII